jgi:hypothetical protein
MPRPSNDVLIRRLGKCTHRLGILSTDEDWNITSRKALPFALEDEGEFARFVVLVRFHYPFFSDKINAAIRRAVNLRAPDAFIRARWNQHEAVFILSENPERFVLDLKPILKNEGLKFAVAVAPFSGNIEYDHDRAVQELWPELVEEQ